MSDAPVLVEKRDDLIAVITLNRPDKLNALNAEVRRILRETFADLERDDAVRAVVIHGTGDKAFVAGADIAEFAARTAEEQRLVYEEPRIYEAVADFSKPVIAAIHGFCIGGGCELALACVETRSRLYCSRRLPLSILIKYDAADFHNAPMLIDCSGPTAEV